MKSREKEDVWMVEKKELLFIKDLGYNNFNLYFEKKL
jgi:hypothetical protein